MENRCVLLDTNFCIQLLKKDDPLHKNVLGYFRTFLEKDIRLKFSTISIAEYCVRGQLAELPLKTLEIVPFNTIHAVEAGELTRVILENQKSLFSEDKAAIKDDIKLLAQVKIETEITTFASSDKRLLQTLLFLSKNLEFDVEIINTVDSYSTFFGVLPFED